MVGIAARRPARIVDPIRVERKKVPILKAIVNKKRINDETDYIYRFTPQVFFLACLTPIFSSNLACSSTKSSSSLQSYFSSPSDASSSVFRKLCPPPENVLPSSGPSGCSAAYV